MKKLVLIFLAFVIPLWAQTDKGKMSLIFNDEKFDVPIRTITINKDNNVNINIRGEVNDTAYVQWISFELNYDDLSKQKLLGGLKDFRLQIQSQNKKDRSSKRFVFGYGLKNAEIEFFKNGERMNWQTPSLEFKINTTDVVYDGKVLKITGLFSGKVKSNTGSVTSKIEVEIKDGVFEIVL